MKQIIYNPLIVRGGINASLSSLDSIDIFIAQILAHITELESKLDFEFLQSLNAEATNKESLTLDTKEFQNILNALPIPPKEGWERKKLGELTQIQSGGTPSRNIKDYWNGDINWIKSEVCQNCYVYENQVKEKITELGMQNSSAKKLKKDSVLIALVGATIGKVGYLTFESTTNQNIAGLYPLNLTSLNHKFLYFACLGLYSNFRELGDFSMANLTFIKNLKIPLPPLKSQQQIVNVIENIESHIVHLDSMSPLLESKKQEILLESLM